MINAKSDTGVSIPLIAGQKSREYRKKLAFTCDKPANAVQTVKFQLEVPEGMNVPDFSSFRQSYDVVEGTAKGSLTYFLFTLVASGFRLFSSSEKAINFASSAAFDEAGFLAAAEKFLGFRPIGFTPRSVIERLKSAPKKAAAYDAETLKGIYLNSWFAKEEREQAAGLVGDITQALTDHFSDWKELTVSVPEALRVVDMVLSGRGAFPSIAEMLANRTNTLPKKSSIAFDPKAVVAAADEKLNPYVAVASLLQQCEPGNKKKPAAFIKENLTTTNNNALSWLFNTGLKLFRTTPVTSDNPAEATLQKWFSVPDNKLDAVRQVKEAAEAIPEQTLFFRNKTAFPYSQYRSAFGGHIDSWTSNYARRLDELNELMKKLPQELKIPEVFDCENGSFIENAGINREELTALVAAFAQMKKDAQVSLDRLCGRAEDRSLPTASDIEMLRNLTASINRLHAIYKTLANSLKQASEDKNSPWKMLSSKLGEDWKVWKELKELPKLNGLSGGVPQEETELNRYHADFTLLESCRKQDYQRVLKWAEENDAVNDLFESLQEAEALKLSKRPSEKLTAEVQAARWLLNRVASAARKSDDAVCRSVRAWIKEKNIFANEKDFNKYFCNLQGSLYVSPFSQRKHEGYALGDGIVERIGDIWMEFENKLKELEATVSGFSQEKASLLNIQQMMMNLKLSLITKDIPKEVAALTLPEVYADSNSEEVQIFFKQDLVPVFAFSKGFNVYTSLLSGLNTQLRRERFYLRTKFSWIENNQLAYIPKAKAWNMPARYEKVQEWSDAIKAGLIIRNEDGSVDSEKTFEKILSLSASDLADAASLLIQLPHDWCYVSPFETKDVADKRVLFVSKDGGEGTVLTPKKVAISACLRLIGPSAFKSRLDKMMLMPKSHTAGDSTLLVDAPVEQRIENGNVILTPQPLKLTLAMPLTLVASDAEKGKAPFTHLIGIDQGEAGIAYAVFKLDDAGNEYADAVATGTVRIPSIRRLIKGVKKFRKSKQTTEKFNQRFDSTQFNIRENVAGDVCHAIIGLMAKYNAFPVLEYQVSNLESGSKQLSLVYKAVNAHFFGDVDAHKTMRKQMWFSAENWTIPGLNYHWKESKQNKKGKITVKEFQKQLQVWPGNSVSAQYTSRICSHCHRNISKMLYELRDDENYKKIVVNKDGEAQINGHIVKLYGPDKEHDAKYYRRRNERVPLTSPLSERELSLKEFERIVKRNLRRPPKSLQTKDTSQSRFFCVFKDCEKHNQEQHADVNAAINIGRRFLAHLSKAESKE